MYIPSGRRRENIFYELISTRFRRGPARRTSGAYAV